MYNVSMFRSEHFQSKRSRSCKFTFKKTGSVKILSMLYLMFNSTQLFLESLKTSQEMLFSQAFNHPSSVTASVSNLIHTQVRYQKQKMFFFFLPPYSKRCCILFLLLNPSDSCCGFLSKSVVSFFFSFPSLSRTNKEYE